MAKLLSRDRFPPKGFCVLVPAAGMKEPFSGSFSECVTFLINFRRSNPALVAKNGWSLAPEDVAADVDAENTARMIAHGWLSFVDLEGDPEPDAQKKTWVGRLAGAAARVKNAAGMYADLFGPGGKTVTREEAERRAAVCVSCPLNKLGGFTEFFVEGVAKELMHLLGMMRDLNLTTSLESKLGTCQACTCPIAAKVHVELKHIRAHMDSGTMAKLNQSNPRCWILPTPAGS